MPSRIPDSEDEAPVALSDMEQLTGYSYYFDLLLEFTTSIDYFIVAGRRGQLSHEDRKLLRETNEVSENLTIRTYDWLLDAATMR